MKRRGVIAALFAGVLSKAAAQQTSASSILADGLAFEVKFQKGPRRGFDCHGHPVNGGLFTQICEEIPEPEFVLTVSYGDETVKLTAQQVMDALREVQK